MDSSEYAYAINKLSQLCRKENNKWWHDPKTGKLLERNKGELLMLMVSELAEAMEGVRKNLNDDKLPDRKMEEVELIDCLIRIFDYLGEHYPAAGTAFMEKMEYNRNREDHTHLARLKEHGKKF